MSLLSSIKIIDSFGHVWIQSKSSSLLDLIVLYGGSIFIYQGNKQRICYFEDFKCKEIDPIFKQFKVISEIQPKNIEDAIVKLNLLKQSNITEIEHLNFNNLDPDDLKEVVNLNNLNWKLKSFRYNSQDWDLLNNQIYENISLINLQKLYLSGLSSISNSLRVLSNLPYDTTIDLTSSSPEFFNLKFTKLELLSQSNSLCLG